MKYDPSKKSEILATQLMAVEIISELLASTNPNHLGTKLTEQLRELTGARTVMLITHPQKSGNHKLVTISPQRRASLISNEDLLQFCPLHTKGNLPFQPDELPADHPIKKIVVDAGIQSFLRFPLYATGDLVGFLLLLDLPDIHRIKEIEETVSLFSLTIALALRNALSHQQIETQAENLEILTRELEQRVTERTRELEEACQFNEQVIQCAKDGIVVYDLDLQYKVWNQAMEKLTGVKASEVIGQNPFHKFPFLIETGLQEKLQKALQGDSLSIIEFPFKNPKTGQSGWVSDTNAPLRNSNGEIIGVIGVVRDITAQKHAEETHRKLQYQLMQSQKMESVGRLAGGVAHDFNNMLSVILGYGDLLLAKIGTDDPLYNDIQQIMKAGNKSVELIRQLLTFARKQTISPKIMNLNTTVQGTLKMLQRLIGEDIELVWKPAKNICLVKMDPAQIDQILANLCVNARDAISDIGKITIETSNVNFQNTDFIADELRPGRYVMLAVSDNGAGMDLETQAKIFEPFFTTKKRGEGTGLGLSTVYGIVKQNGGMIYVYSELGIGTQFKIYLPCHLEAGTEGEQEIHFREIKNGTETILLVEDEKSLLEMTKRFLQRLGYTVLAANTPLAALKLAEEHSREIHLLLTDVIMPEMNGRDLKTKISSLLPNVKCLFMSGYTADVIACHGVLEDSIYFLQKPFTIHSLSVKLREVLEA